MLVFSKLLKKHLQQRRYEYAFLLKQKSVGLLKLTLLSLDTNSVLFGSPGSREGSENIHGVLMLMKSDVPTLRPC